MTANNQSDRSPAPGIIPGPVHVSEGTAPPPVVTEKRAEPKGRRNPVRIAGAKVMSALRGDKHMVGAYPTASPDDPAAPGNSGSGAPSAKRCPRAAGGLMSAKARSGPDVADAVSHR
jgi:hypothetical protein